MRRDSSYLNLVSSASQAVSENMQSAPSALFSLRDGRGVTFIFICIYLTPCDEWQVE